MSQSAKRQGLMVVLIALLIVVPLTAILTAVPAHAGGPTLPCPPLPPYTGVCVEIGQLSIASLTSGQPPSPSTIGNPTAVAFDSKGDLWVVDTTNNRVLEYKPPFPAFAEAASLVIGQTSLTGSGDTSPAGSLFGPTGLAFDPSGNLWVVDSGNNRILEFKTPFSNGESASIVLGQPTFGGYIGTTTSGGLNSPSYLAFDPSGNLWVTDQGNDRVLEFTAPFSTGEKASVVIGQADFTSSAPASTVTAKSLFEPLGIAFDSKGDMWVVDSADHRVLEYNAPFSTDEAASMVIGQSSLTGSSTGLSAYAIAFDSGGDLWISDGISGVAEVVAPLSTGEAVTQVIGPKTIASGEFSLREPQGLTLDAGNNVWVADYDHGRVVVYGSGATPTTISSTCSSTTASGALGGGIYDNVSASSSAGTSSCSSTTTSSASGGVPVFPYQPAIAAVFTVLLVSTYLLVRHRSRPWSHGKRSNFGSNLESVGNEPCMGLVAPPPGIITHTLCYRC